jgi:hypothetical protein
MVHLAKNFKSMAAVASFATLATLALAGPPVDGTREVANYPTAAALQTNQTNFGNAAGGSLFTNEGELAAMYVTNDATNVYVMITGNLGTNGNGLVVWFDNTADATGNSTAPNIAGGDGYFSGGKLGGTVFPSGFNADYGYVVKCFGNPLEWRYQLADLRGAGSTGSGQGNFPTGATTNPAVNTQAGFTFALNNDNGAGVGSGTGAEAGDMTLVSTGVELAIPRSDLGSPADGTEIRLIALYANADFNFWSNQILPARVTAGDNIGNSFPIDLSTGTHQLAAPGYASYTLTGTPAAVENWSMMD